jgi:outer membrane protein OmpA-like peptidoglycan-associated protein
MFTLNSNIRKVISLLVGAALTLTMVSNTESAKASFAPPIMATIFPSSGTVTGGDLITITGQNLQRVNDIEVGGTRVFREDLERSPIGEWITFRAPYSSKTGPVDVTFLSTVNVTEPNFYTYTPSSITSVTPALGTFRGGTVVNIRGAGFGPMEWGDGSLIVKFNGVNATAVKRVSPTQITATTPLGTQGDATIEISFGNDPRQSNIRYSANVITQAKAFLYTPEVLAPKVDLIIPDRGVITGGTPVTVTGRYLRGSDNLPATFSFGGALATNVVVAPDGLSATMTTPARPAGAVSLVATNVDSSSTVANAYTYAAPPTITSLSPASGVIQGGTLVTINGTNFGSAGIPLVKFGGSVGLCVKLISPTQLTAVTRSNVAGQVDVEVTPITGGGIVTKQNVFNYQAPAVEPVISSVTPDSGPTTGANTVEFKTTGVFPPGTPNVMFGNSCALSVTRVDDKTIRATAPSNPAGARNVGITFANGYSFLANGYTYFVPTPPEVTKVTPAVDFSQGGITVNIEGLGFGESGIPQVRFGTVNATNVVRVSNTLVTATVPANTVGAKEVSVTPVGGTAIKKANAFTYKAPVINNVKPNSGVVLGGTNVVITGDGFGTTGTPVVKFGGKLATNVVRVDNFKINATTPSGTKGFTAVEVTPAGGTAITSSTVYAYFELQVAPQLDASSLTWLPPAGGTPVTVTGSNFKGTDGKPGKVYIAGTLVPATVSADGRSVTFTPPALAPSNFAYEFRITTNEGSAWRNIFRVAMGPSGPPGGCDFNTYGGRNMDGGGNRTIYLNNGSLMLGELGNPTVTVNGTLSPIVVAGNTGGQSPRDFVTFSIPTSPQLSLGGVTVVVTMGQNAGSITNDCFTNLAYMPIEAQDKTIMFGQAPGPFLYTVSGERGNDKVTSVLYSFTGIDGTNYATSQTVPTAAGRYQIRPSNAVMNPGTLSLYNYVYLDGVFTIQGIPAVVRAIQCTTKIYGDPNPNISYSVTGLPETESIKAGSVTYVYEGFRNTGAPYGPTTVMPTRAGEYTITPRDAELNSVNTPSISFSYESCNYVITKRPVSIEAVDTQKVYGSQDPAKTWTFTDESNKNLAPGDATLEGSVIVDRYLGENVGDYDYIPASLDDENPDYAITYSYWGKLTINKKPINVTGVNTTKNYCQPDPEFLYSSAGLVGQDRLSGSLSRVEGNNVGNYAYTAGTLDGGNNYIINSVTGGQLTITTCPLSVQADYNSKIYGELDPTLTYYFSGDYGLMFEDSMTGTLSRGAGANVGTYSITKGNLSAGANYSITYLGNTFEIFKRPLCLAADNKTKVYGDADPGFTRTQIINSECFSLIGSDAITGILSREPGSNVGFYDITPGTVTAGNNYETVVTDGSLEITPRPITITPDAKSKTYGDSDPTLTWSITSGNTIGSDTLSGSLRRADGSDVGTYDYVLGEELNLYNPNYDITVNTTNKFTIIKKRITVTGVDTEKYYGESDPELDYQSSGLVGNDRLTGALGRAAGESVGNYSYTAGDLAGGDNYIVDSVSGGKLVIKKRPIDVCAESNSKTYGDADPTLGYNICGQFDLVPPDAFTGSVTRAAGSDVGTYRIQNGSLALSANYELSFYEADFVINPKKIYLDAPNKTKVYGDADPALTWALAAGSAWVGSDSPTVNLTRAEGDNVGNYDISVSSVDGGSNYDIEVSSGYLEITQRFITVKPDGNTKVYGDNDPTLTYTVSVGTLGYKDQLAGSLSRASGEDVNSYSVDLGDFVSSNPNYNISLDAANQFTITKRPVTVTAEAKSKEYGQNDPGLTYTTSVTTLDNGTNVSLGGDLTRIAGETVGDHNIVQGTITDANNSNYTITFVVGKLTITKRDVSICADDKEHIYGESRPANSAALCDGSSFVGPDALGSVTFTFSTANPVNAGEYTITPSAAVLSTGDPDNYNISYETATLTINKRQITVTADDKVKTYGDNDPTFTYIRTSGTLVGSDSFTGTLSRESGENVGDYDVTLGSLSLGDNYDVTLSGGKLTINKLAIRVVPTPNQKKSYGDNNPTYTFASNITLPFSDSLAGALGRDSGEDVSSYAYTIGDVASSNPNYDITLDTANKFNIEKLVITVTVNNLEKFYGEADPAYTYTFSPATLGNGSAITLTGAPTRAAGENVGDYVISVGTLSAGSNYQANITAGAKLTIKKVAITITAGNQNMVYGSALPTNSLTVTGTLAFSESVSSVTYTYSTNPPRNVGTYDITPSAAVVSGGLASNYDITYVKGELVVTKAPLTIYIASANSDWGDKVAPAGASSSEGLKNGDKVGEFNYTFNGSATEPGMPGTYELDGTVASFDTGTPDNYDITIVPATYTINSPFFVSIEPKRGPVAGGTRFTINGFGFGFNNPIVRFDGLDATEVTLNGSTQITGVTPPHPEGPVNVTLVTDAGTLEFGEVYTYFPPKPTPQISALAPVKGTTAGGTKVTMTGSAFKGSDGKVAKIYVNGVLATGVKVSKDGMTVEFITPPNTQGLSDIRVATNDGSFTYADAFEYIPGAKTSKAFIIFDGDKSVLLKPAIDGLNKLLKGIPKGANIVSVSVNGWVKRTASTAIDAKLSLARATVTANFLKKAGIKAKIVTNGKGIYRLGNDQDRRAEIEITWIK